MLAVTAIRCIIVTVGLLLPTVMTSPKESVHVYERVVPMARSGIERARSIVQVRPKGRGLLWVDINPKK